MCQKCLTVAKSSAQGPGPGSRMWIKNIEQMWPVSQIRSDPIRFNSEMCRKCVTVVESSAQGPGPGSENVPKVYN